MKKAFVILLVLLPFMVFAQKENVLNAAADNIVGNYEASQQGDRFKAQVVKLADGTYEGRVYWMERPNDSKGNKRLDTKNPDKSLRKYPLENVVIFTGLVYNSSEHRWDSTKIYDPHRGVRAKMVASFQPDGRLKIKGSLMGFSESVYWKRIK